MNENVRQERKLTPGELLQLRQLERNNDPRRLPDSWRYLSQTYTALMPAKAGRNDVGVFIKPGAGEIIGAHGYYASDMARIVLDGGLLPCDPSELNPRANPEHFQALAVFHGVFIHEAGHAAHTRHLNEPEGYRDQQIDVGGTQVKGATALYCAQQLEEIRMEAQVARERPEDVRWIKTAMRKLHADVMTGQLEFQKALDKMGVEAGKNLQVAICSIYTLGRLHAGTIDEDDVRAFSEKLDELLDAETRAEMEAIFAEAVEIADADQDELIGLGERLAALFSPECDCACHGEGEGEQGEGQDQERSEAQVEGQGGGQSEGDEEAEGDEGQGEGGEQGDGENTQGQGGGGEGQGGNGNGDRSGEGDEGSEGQGDGSGERQDESCSDCGCGGHSHGGGSGGNGASGPLSEQEADELLDEAAEALAEAAREQLDEMDPDDPARGEIEQIADKQQAREKIEEANRAVGGTMAGSPAGAQPARGEREPTGREKTARVRLSQKLREVRWRERARVKRNIVLPPGRMRGRELIRERVDHSRGMPSQAQPWKRKRSQHVDLPVVTCGVLLDTSGSMGGCGPLLSSALWVIANAIADNGGRTGGYAFGNAVEPVLSPEAPPRFVTTFSTGGGTAGVPETLKFAEDDLLWEDAYGPRLLVICSDGYWGDAASTADALMRVKKKGIKVILAGIKHRATDYGMPELFDQQVVVEDEHQLAKVIGDAAVKELRNF